MKPPAGFRAAAVACGLKPSGRPDLGLIVADAPAVAAGVVTANRVRAAPVTLTRRHLRRGTARAVVVNAGNANACTGRRGLDDARAMAKLAATAAGARERDVLVASTGIIGRHLDMGKVASGIDAAAARLSPDGLEEVARAIMTTDTTVKSAEAPAGPGRVVGIAKGAGMIAPEMATMLAFVLTDLPLSRSVLAGALAGAQRETFGMISVDGCISTNDCVLALASGAAGGAEIGPGDPLAEAFGDALREVCGSLALQMVEDGEGATKVVTIRVRSAANEREARRAARALADSLLLRCAVHGADPNWGRAVAALGASGIPLDPNRIDVSIGGERVCERGTIGPGDLGRARAAMAGREVEIVVELNRGAASCEFLTNDLSAEYVRINSEYTT